MIPAHAAGFPISRPIRTMGSRHDRLRLHIAAHADFVAAVQSLDIQIRAFNRTSCFLYYAPEAMRRFGNRSPAALRTPPLRRRSAKPLW